MMKRVAIIATTVLATLAALALLWEFWNVVVLFLVSLGVAAMVRTPAEWLSSRPLSRPISRGLAVVLVLLMGLGVLIGLIVLVVPTLTARIPMLLADLNGIYTRFQAHIAEVGSLQRTLANQLPAPENISTALLNVTDENGSLAWVMSLTSGLFDALAQSLLVIFLAIYWAIDRDYFERLALSLLPPTQRIRMRALWRNVESHVGAYLRAIAAQILFGGILLYVGFALLGVKYPLILACAVALLWLMPVIGPLVAVLPVLLIGYLTSPLIAMLAAVYMVVIFAASFVFIERRLYQASRFASVLSLLMMLILVDVLGLPGLLLAPIVATVAQLVVDGLMSLEPIREPEPPLQVDAFADRLTQLRQAMQDMTAATPPVTANLARRLEDLVVQVIARQA